MPALSEAVAPLVVDVLAATFPDGGLRQVANLALGLAILLLGTAITVIAFRGYRRNRSRPMLFIAIGFGLIILVQAVFGLLLYVLQIDVDRFALEMVVQLSQVAGLCSILYALRGRR